MTERARGPRSRRRVVVVFVALALGLVAVASVCIGGVRLSPSDVLGVLSRKAGLAIGPTPDVRATAVVWDIRVPRIAMGAIVGLALAVSGAALQGVFRNGMADPHLLGIGPGAAVGGAIGAAIGSTTASLAGAAIAGVVTAVILRLLVETRETERARFILMGVALGLALSAWVGFAVFAGGRTRVQPVEFWLLGSFSTSTWRILGLAAAAIAAGVVVLVLGHRTLDVLMLGEAEARHLGVRVERFTTLVLVVVGAVVGASVGAAGVVAFVGLLVPHVVRRLVGPRHGMLFAGCALAGPLFVVGADLLARSLYSPVEIPVGLVTAAVAGPFFLWLARRARGVIT